MSWGARRLRELRDRLNPDASSSRVGAGFASVAGGLVLAILGVGLVVLNDLALPRPSWLREVGFVSAAAGLPLFLMGLAVTLPSTRLERVGVGLGSLLVAASVTAFAAWYPEGWHLTVQAPNGYAIGGYLIGITLVSAGTASCLARHIVSTAAPGQRARESGEGREWTGEDVREDLRWAEEQGYTWGGIPDGQPASEITLEKEVEAVEFQGQAPQFLVTEEEAEEPQRSSRRLRALQGRMDDDRSRVDSDVHEQVGDLAELQRRKREQRRERRQSWSWRLRHPIRWLRGP